MIRTRSAIAALLLFMTGETLALSCAPPQFDAEAIDRLDIIFEGSVEKKQPLSLWRRLQSATGLGDGGDARIYTFAVSQLWKGRPVDGDRVEILAPPRWGQDWAFQVGESYLVFGEISNEAGTYTSNPGWCGFDLLPRDEVLRVLEQYLSRRHQTAPERRDPGQGAVGSPKGLSSG